MKKTNPIPTALLVEPSFLTPHFEQKESPFSFLAEEIEKKGYVILDNALPLALFSSLFEHVNTIEISSFVHSNIGRKEALQKQETIRNDRILWLDSHKKEDEPYLQWMELLRLELNRNLFLGLFDFECHFALFQKGNFYKQHLDALQGSRNRIISTILYMNSDWNPYDGGELVLYAPDGQTVLERISPTTNRLVLFLSEVFPHEVLPTQKERKSITGWFRVR